MKIKVIKGSEVSVARRPLSDREVKDYLRLITLGERVGAYGFPLVVLPWPFLQKPIENPSVHWFDIFIFLLIVFVTPIIHEFIHALALPLRIARNDSVIFIKVDGFRSGLFYRPGGGLIGIQFAWMCLLPFLVLTVLPYLLMLGGYINSIHFGILAGYNFGLSGIDLIQAVIVLKEFGFKKIS